MRARQDMRAEGRIVKMRMVTQVGDNYVVNTKRTKEIFVLIVNAVLALFLK